MTRQKKNGRKSKGAKKKSAATPESGYYFGRLKRVKISELGVYASSAE